MSSYESFCAFTRSPEQLTEAHSKLILFMQIIST
jgi:hypothetical protein